MKAFFDTNVYINAFFRKKISRENFEKFFEIYEIVICPIVKHELLLGSTRSETRKELEHFFDECLLLEAPTTAHWSEMTGVMKKLGWKENRQQNDILIALTAKENEATLITYDKHFESIKKHIDFEWVKLKE